VNFLTEGNLQITPIIAIDFSMANLTFTENKCLHSTNPMKQNDYRDLIKLITKGYSNILNIPMFGYGAKTIFRTGSASNFFPLSRNLLNPFIPNDEDIIDETYN
jgi:hypothetical protein